MAEAGVHSLRLNRLESRRLALALALSLMAHLFTWGGYELGQKLGLWQSWHWPAWLHHAEKIKPPPVVQNSEEPLEFVTVDQPSTEAPKDAKYYSSQNSRAANPDASRNSNVPQINGRQTEVPKAEDVARPDFNKLQPSIAQEESQPKNPTPDDLAFLKPGDLQPQQNPAQPRPRTLKEALAQNHLPGLQMRQDGGVPEHSLVPSFDVKQTQFGAYDEAVFEAIQQHWDDLLASQQFARDRTGKVTLRFHLNYDGSITDIELLENNVGDLLGYVCQKAIEDPAPFAPWPSDMRRMVGENYREITLTFYYY
jgi:periplasmic protein TonB